MRVLSLTALLALGACAFETSYVPTGTNTLPVEQARARCEFQTASSPARIANGGIMTPVALMEMCMRGEGYLTVTKLR
jgi:hypothetical protein